MQKMTTSLWEHAVMVDISPSKPNNNKPKSQVFAINYIDLITYKNVLCHNSHPIDTIDVAGKL